MITKYKIFENNSKIINIQVIIPNKLGIELEIKGEYIDLTTYRYINKYIKNRYKYYNRVRSYRYSFFLERYILFYLKQNFNLEPLSHYSNNDYTIFNFKMTIEQAINLSKHLPDSLSQDCMDEFCDEYLKHTINYKELMYKEKERREITFNLFDFQNVEKFLFSDKVKDKHRHIFNAENFDLI
jgi:hypothetical protein